MEEEIQNLKNQALAQITSIETESELEEAKISFLGRQGKIAKITQGIAKLPPEKRAVVGQLVNDTKEAIQRILDERQETLRLKTEKTAWFDPTVPGVKPEIGHLHLVTTAIEEISSIFEKIGFVRVRYPEVEWDWFAFEGLNMPERHPARDEWETFFLDNAPHPKYGQMVLTPHTSSGQLREMARVKIPPVRMLNIAKTYRRQADVSHVYMFHQYEGLVIDKGISLTHLKGALDWFARNFFGPNRKIRLRPFHFRFTEPSFEFDVSCDICGGKGCRLCKAGWLELGGAGMVHPVVLKNGGIDPNKYTGFAFGAGVERTYMMKSGLKINDVRTLYSTDLRFLKQF